MSAKSLFVAAAAALALAQGAMCASIISHKGEVEYKAVSAADWTRLREGARPRLSAGDEVRTLRDGEAEILMNTGSRVRLSPGSSFEVSAEDGAMEALRLSFGRLKAWVRKSGRSFSVRTPTAVCAVRGTEFALDVDPATSNTQVDLFRGTLAVSDNLGNELTLEEGRRLSVTGEGLGEVQQLSKLVESEKQAGGATLAKEVGLAMSKEAVLSAAAEDIKLAEYQQGKSLIDVFGNRVQLEEYVMRPAPDQFKLVVLNKRGERLDYFFYRGTFNASLPTDLSEALCQLGGTQAAPDWYLTSYQTGRSNTADSVEENASGGHPVDVNANADPDDNITSYFDSATDSFVPVSGSFYKTLFDNYAISYNGTQTYGWTPVAPNVQSYLSSAITTSIYGGSANYDIEASFPDGTFLHNRIRETYGTGGEYTQYDNYIFDNDGQPASLDDFAGVTTGPQYKESLLKWNFQQVITSSFFGDRKIDLVVEPKILIQSGLVQ
ncbi:MAG: FecR family protein [Elusimicrobiales bacterium]